MIRPKSLFCVLLLMASALLGCQSGGDGAPAPPFSASAVAEGEPVPTFELDTVEGGSFVLAETHGEVRLVDFWATWCAPCREEIPMLNELQQHYGERGFRIVAISDEDADVIRGFIENHGVDYLNLVGTDELLQTYGVFGLPAAFLIDREGKLVDSYLGPKPAKLLRAKIESLLES